jgi:hypothetical protein
VILWSILCAFLACLRRSDCRVALNHWNLVLLICGLDRSVCVWQTDAFAESWFKSHEKKEKAARHSFQRLRATFSRLMARKIALNHWKAALQAHVYSNG